MTRTILREAIIPRIDGIKKNVGRLCELGKLPLHQFSSGDNYDLAQHNLRLALEGVFHIATHILSRIPGSRATEYKEIAKKMGTAGLVPKKFAEGPLVAMAGMRNMLVHAYADIEPSKLHEIVTNHLGDIETFLEHVGKIIKDSKKFGLEIN